YTGSPLSGVVWANFSGCVVMGFIAEEKHFFATTTSVESALHWGTEKKVIPLYIGIATGFCGSLTSFSTWMRDIFFALSNSQPSYGRNRGYNVEALLAQIIYTIALSL